jgi:PAS domain S-box-containing protein
MNALVSAGIIVLVMGVLVIGAVLLSARLANRRRKELFGSEEPVIPVNLASVNDAVVVARIGGQVVFANEVARQWFALDRTEPDLWLLAQKVQAPDAFLELFAAEGQADFEVGGRRVKASSHRVAVGDTAQFIVVMREEEPLPTLSREERGSPKALRTLSEITQAINASLELDATLNATLEGIRRLIDHDAAQICLWDQERECLRPVARSGPAEYVAATGREDQEYTLGRGYTGWVARKRQGLFVSDVLDFTDTGPLIRPTDPEYRSYIGLPLHVRNRFIGTIEIMAAQPGHFDRDDQALLGLIAEQAAIAIENARRYSSQSERVAELSGVQKIAEAISALQDPHQLFAQLGQRVAELMDTEMAGILLFDRDQEKLIAQKPFYGMVDALASRYSIRLERGSPARSLWEDVAFWLSNDVEEDHLIQEMGLSELAEMAGLRSTAMAIMRVGDERIGVLQVGNKRDGTPFNLEDIRLLQIYAGQAAIIVESARLYREEQSRVAELHGLQQIAQAMSAFTNPEELYAQLTQRIAELMKVDICGVLIYEPEQEKLVARTPFYGVSDEVAQKYSLSVGRRGLARDIWRDYDLFESNNVFADDNIDTLGLREFARSAGLHTLLFAPLSAGGRRFGLLQVSNKSDGTDFDDNDKRLLSIFAGQAAALIDNARLYQDTDATLRKRSAELRSVSRISRELNATLELERILEVISAEALRAEGARWGNLVMFEWDETNTRIIPTMRFGTELGEEARILELAAARSGDTLVIDDFEKVAHYPSPIAGARSALLVPIHFEGKVVGVIGLYSDKPRGLGPSAAEFVQALSSQATIAVTNATRHAEQVERSELLRRRAEQLTQIFELGRMFRGDQSVEENLNSVARAICESAGFNLALVSALDEKGETLRHVAQFGLSGEAYNQACRRETVWRDVEVFLDDKFRQGGSYFVPCEESANLIRALGLEPRPRPLNDRKPGHWQSGDLLLIPLRSTTDQIMGVLSIDQPRNGMIPTANTIELLEIFANQAAIVIENSRLYRSVEERAEELSKSLASLEKSYEELDKLSHEMIRKDAELSRANELLNLRAQRLLALHRIMESVDTSRSPEAVLRDIAASVVEEMDVDQCVIALGSDKPQIVAAEGRLPKGLDLTGLLDGKDPITMARRTNKAVFYTQNGDVKARNNGAARLAKEIGAHTLMALPMNLGDSQDGVLMIGSTRRGISFGDDERDLFGLLASQIVVEYENARLYQAVQKEAATAAAERDRLQQLHLITTALQQTRELKDRLAVIARGIRSVGWRRVAVMLLDSEMNVTDLVTAGYTAEEEEQLRKNLLPGEVWRRRFDDQEFISMRVGASYFLACGHPWVMKNVEGMGEADFDPAADPTRWQPKDQLYVPMYAGTQIIGLINLRDPVNGLRPTEASLRPLELFVQQASSALENIRLYQETVELQSFTEAVLQSIQQGIVVTDKTGEVESINAFMHDRFGWSEGLVGKKLFEARADLRELGLEDDFKAVADGGSPVERTNVSYKVGQEVRTLNIYLYPRYDEQHNVTGVVLLMEDITQRARLEADIAQRGRQLAALSEVSRTITAALSVEDVISSALDQTRTVMPYDRVTLCLFDREEEKFAVAGVRGHEGEVIPSAQRSLQAEEALFDEIARDKQVILIGDVRGDSRLTDADSRTCRTWLGAPMVSGGLLVGVMIFERDETHAYAPADGQVAAAFANQVAVAIENARLFEEAADRAAELHSRTRRLTLLNRISSTLGRSLDQNSILQTTVDELAQALEAPQGSVILFDREAGIGRLICQHPSNPDGSVEELIIPFDDNPALQRLNETKSPVAIEDVKADPLFTAMREPFSRRKVKSILLVPLIVGNMPAGMITVEETSKKRHFEPEQIELAQTITNQAAVSVQNAQLFQETVSRQRELTVLSEAGRIAASSLDLDTVVRNAAEYFIRALEVDGCTIALLQQAEDALITLIDYTPVDGARPLSEFDNRYNLSRYPVTSSAIAERGVVVLDASSEELSEQEAAWLRRKGIASLLVVPLVARDQTIGLAELWVTRTGRRFRQREIGLAKALASTVATAMENARLHDETQKRVGELAMINEISRALTQVISTEDLYQLLQEQLRAVLNARSMTIAQRDPLTGLLTFPLVVRNGLRIHVDPIGYGGDLYSHVIERWEPLLITRNVEQRLEELQVRHIEEGLKSFLAVPLYSGEVIGVLAVEDYERENVFHEADLRVLNPIAAQVAVSLENARLYSELEQRLSETTTLQEVSRVVNSALDLHEIFERVVRELASAFKYPIIGLYTLEDRELRLQAHHGYTSEQVVRVQALPLDTGVIGRAARTGEPQFVKDVTQDPDYVKAIDWVRYEIAIPIVSDQDVLGILDVQAGLDNPLADNDLQLLRTFAGQVATAMANAALYEQMVKLSEELEQRVEERTRELREERDRIDTLYRITVELNASLDLDRVLNRALELVGEAVGAEHGSLFLIDPQSDQLIYRAVMSDYEILPPGGRQIQLKRHEGMAGWVMDNRQSLLVDNVLLDPRWVQVPGTEERRSLLGAPLIANEEVLGCIFFASDVPGAFNEGHLRLVEAAANQVATSINNAELYRLIRDQAERLGVMLRSQQTEAAKSQAILESVADGVMVSDQSGEIILFNAAAERILELRRDEVLGRSASDLTGLYGAGAAKWATLLHEWSEDPRSYAGEFLAEQIEVGDKVVSVHVSPVMHGDELLGLVSVFRDITREVAADRIKSEFVATVSHELRTPMTSIKGYADLLLLGAAGEITPEQRRFLEVVKSNADRLSLLVNDLLDISRIEQGRAELDIRPVDMRELIDDVIASLEGRRENEGRHIQIRAEVPAELPTLQGDYDRITQILTNLVNNAYQYTPDEGSVTVRAVPDGQGIQVDVIDTGIGIPDEDKPRIFERFFRGEDPLVMKTAGTGLGLAIVQRLVAMHGGRIWFESQQGIGTTFSVWLPYQASGSGGN